MLLLRADCCLFVVRRCFVLLDIGCALFGRRVWLWLLFVVRRGLFVVCCVALRARCVLALSTCGVVRDSLFAVCCLLRCLLFAVAWLLLSGVCCTVFVDC